MRREVHRGQVWSGIPTRAVQDTDDLLVLYLAPGTPLRFGAGPLATETGRHAWDCGEDPRWEGHGVLMLQRPDDAHAVWVVWEGEERSHRCWYVNLQDPLRRTSIGVDTFDHELDVVVHPDLSWHWKDAELMDRTVELGRFTPDEVSAIWAEGERVVAMVEAGDPWWDPAWAAWVPPATWTTPTLPRGWQDASP